METDDHSEWLSGIVITDVRSVKEDAENSSELLLDVPSSKIEEVLNMAMDDTDSEGEEVDVENIEEEFANEPQCEALRKLTNLSTVELENQALCLSEEDNLREFLKITLEGAECEERESSDSETEINDCDILKGEKHIDRKVFDIKNNDNTEKEYKASFGYPCDRLLKARDLSMPIHLQKSDQEMSHLLTGPKMPNSNRYFISNEKYLNNKCVKDSCKAMSKICVQSHHSHSKLSEENDHEQDEDDRKLFKNYYPLEVFDEPEFVDIIPNFAGFPSKICQIPKHKLWRVKHLNTNKYVNDSNTSSILCNKKKTTNSDKVIQHLNSQHCHDQKLDDKLVVNNEVMEVVNKFCRKPGPLVKKNSSADKFHNGIMTRKRTALFKEIFSNEENSQINKAALDAVDLRNKEVKNDIGQLNISNHNFLKKTDKCNKPTLDLIANEKVTREIEFAQDTYNINKNCIMQEKHLNYNNEKINKTEFCRKLSKSNCDVKLLNGNFSKNASDNSKSDIVKLHMNETGAKMLNAFCNKEIKENSVNLNIQAFHKCSQDTIVIDLEEPQHFDSPDFCNGNKKLGVRNVLIRHKGYKRKLSFGSDGGMPNSLALEKETSDRDNFFSDQNVNLKLENKRNSRYPMVSLKRCDEDINTLLYNGKQIYDFNCFTDPSIIAERPSHISTLEKINSISRSNPPVNDYSNFKLNVEALSFQSVSDACKNISKVSINNTVRLIDDCDLDVNESLLSNSTEVKSAGKILSSCAKETNVSFCLRNPAIYDYYQNKDVRKNPNVNVQEFSCDCNEFPIDKFNCLKPQHFSNSCPQSLNCENELEVKPPDNPSVRHSIFSQFRENKENLTDSVLNLQCSVCLENIPKKSLLKHMSVHIKDDNFVCNKCNSIFIDLYSLKEHYPICSVQNHCLIRAEETGSGEFGCTICDHCFTLKVDYDNHLKFHLGLANFMCEICGFAFISELLLESHKKSHFEHTVGIHSYNVCVRQCDNFQDKIQHEKSYSNHYKSIYCVMCSKYFNDAVSLHLHLQTFHEISTYNCKKCNLTLIQVSEIEDHFYYRHFSCYKCDLSFNCLEEIRGHVTSHHLINRISDSIKVIDKDIAKQYETINCTT